METSIISKNNNSEEKCDVNKIKLNSKTISNDKTQSLESCSNNLENKKGKKSEVNINKINDKNKMEYVENIKTISSKNNEIAGIFSDCFRFCEIC